MIVVIVGILFGAATLLRSKKSATPASQETAQNSAAAASAPADNSIHCPGRRLNADKLSADKSANPVINRFRFEFRLVPRIL